jgi:RNA polymerase sigma-70 factor, ECF subfamily
VDISDGDLVRRARTGDSAAFRLLVERHWPTARARAVRLSAHRDDVDDIVQEAFLQAFVGLGRLRDPDRFGAWLGGIVRNVHRAAARRAPLTLLADWPEELHPASAQGLPSADDLDRAQALRAAVADLPAGQRQAVELYYYADRPAGQIAASPGAAKVSLHRARRRLRAHITAHRPDLIPAPSRRTLMTTVRIAHAEPRFGERLDGSTAIRHVLVVLAEEDGHRAMGLWLRSHQGQDLVRVLHRPSRGTEPPGPPEDPPAGELPARGSGPEDLAGRLLSAAGGAVTGVDIDELGPDVLAAHIGVTGPAGTRQVTAHLGSGLALAAATGAPVRVADALMSRLAILVTGDDLLEPFVSQTPDRPGGQRSQPQNLTFTDGLAGWMIGGGFQAEVTGAHRHDYSAAAADGVATLSATVPRPYSDAFIGQAILADDYRGATVTFSGEVRAENVADHAELCLHVAGGNRDARPGVHAETPVITGSHDWTRLTVTAEVPGDAEHIRFDFTLMGPGRVELRNVELTRS